MLFTGLLAAVGSPSVGLVGTDISLTWTAPFTLDISNVDPDITYCVDVVNSTSSSIVLSECGITVTGFNFSIPLGRVCDNFSFTVIPVNRAGNGTAVTLGYSITGMYMCSYIMYICVVTLCICICVVTLCICICVVTLCICTCVVTLCICYIMYMYMCSYIMYVYNMCSYIMCMYMCSYIMCM